MQGRLLGVCVCVCVCEGGGGGGGGDSIQLVYPGLTRSKLVATPLVSDLCRQERGSIA